MPDITEKNTTGIDGVGASAPTPACKDLSSSTGQQIAWFIGLFCAGLLATALVVYFFRTLLGML